MRQPVDGYFFSQIIANTGKRSTTADLDYYVNGGKFADLLPRH
ncbi:MAG TPA: hypothetical protein VGJ04_01650 [Pirellulales bacterium]